IVSTLSELTTRTEQTNIPQLSQALTTLGDTINAASPNVQATFTGLSRVSQAIATRDESIQQLLHHADDVTRLLAERRGDLTTLMKQGDLVFKELIARRDAIHSLLVNATRLADNLRGVATDNQAQIKDALGQLSTALTFLRGRQQQLDTALKNLGPYASILINVIGTGPWFDAFVPNVADFGAFKSGRRPNYP
ncbi:MAG: virulence factor Mce family protein, partial [Marmoricola sp.]|nr:virulence factor Mce family protein [Marmoricola sp.]